MDRINLVDFTEPEIFIDTNIFIYAIAKNHRYKHICERLLSKINDGEIIGFTSSTAINELFHTVLVGEVRKNMGKMILSISLKRIRMLFLNVLLPIVYLMTYLT